MVEAEKDMYWSNLAEKGMNEKELKEKLNTLLLSYDKESPSSIFIEKTSTFQKEFTHEINSKLDAIFTEYSFMKPKEITQRKKKFLKRLQERADLILNKKGFCKISFSSYPLFQFFDGLSSIIDEVEFVATREHLKIAVMDPSRICLLYILFKHKSYQFFREGKLGINIDDLKKLIKSNSSDNSHTALIFAEDRLHITIKSRKYNSTINRTLQPLDLDREEVPIENLLGIVYPSEFSILPSKLDYVIRNMDLYSEIITIKVNSNEISFSESGQLGAGNLKWTKNKIKQIHFELDSIREELKDETLSEGSKTILKNILEDKECCGAYSFTFMKQIGNMAKILVKGETINFNVKTDHPLKIYMRFKDLGNSEMLFWLSPRVEEAEFDEDDEDIDDF